MSLIGVELELFETANSLSVQVDGDSEVSKEDWGDWFVEAGVYSASNMVYSAPKRMHLRTSRCKDTRASIGRIAVESADMHKNRILTRMPSKVSNLTDYKRPMSGGE